MPHLADKSEAAQPCKKQGRQFQLYGGRSEKAERERRIDEVRRELPHPSATTAAATAVVVAGS